MYRERYTLRYIRGWAGQGSTSAATESSRARLAAESPPRRALPENARAATPPRHMPADAMTQWPPQLEMKANTEHHGCPPNQNCGKRWWAVRGLQVSRP